MILSKKVNLTFGIIALIFALALFTGSVALAFVNDFPSVTEKVFTCEKTEKAGGKHTKYNIYTAETVTPFVIYSNANKYLDKDEFLQLTQGDTLNCKVISGNDRYSYEIVELIVNGKVLLSLDNAKKAHKTNSATGAIIVAATGALMLILGSILLYRAKYGYSEKHIKKQNDVVRKTMLHYAEENGMDLQEKQQMLDMADNLDISDELPCPKDELIKKFENCFYTQNSREYITVWENLSNESTMKVFKEVLQKTLQVDELRVCYDAALTDFSAVYILYRNESKIFVTYIFKDENTGKYHVNEFDASNDFWDDVSLNRSETLQLVEKLREYNRLKEDIFDIDSKLM